MQILKSSKERMGTFNEYVPSNPHGTVINLDKVAANAKMYAKMSTDFNDEDGRTASQRYEELLDLRVDTLIRKFPPHLAKGEYLVLVIKNEEINKISWNREALRLFIRTGTPWFNPFDKLERALGKQILLWARVDFSNMDALKMKEEVDKALVEFAFQYLKSVEKLEENNKQD